MKDIKHIRRDFYSVTSGGTAPGVCFGGTGGAQGLIFFKHGHVAYQIDGDDEQNKMQVNFYPSVKLVTLGRGQKGQISLTCQFQRFLFQTLCVFSQIKDRNILNIIFILLPGSCPWMGLWGAGGVKNFSVGICDGAPSFARSILLKYCFNTPVVKNFPLWKSN